MPLTAVPGAPREGERGCDRDLRRSYGFRSEERSGSVANSPWDRDGGDDVAVAVTDDDEDRALAAPAGSEPYHAARSRMSCGSSDRATVRMMCAYPVPPRCSLPNSCSCRAM